MQIYHIFILILLINFAPDLKEYREYKIICYGTRQTLRSHS